MRIMVIGASRDRAKFGNKAVRAYARQGHDVVPVNPSADEIEGLPAFADVADPEGPIDRASIYLHPEQGEAVLRALADRGDVGEVWLNPGAESEELINLGRDLGLTVIVACSIVDIGERP